MFNNRSDAAHVPNSYFTLIVLVWKFGNFFIGARLQYDRETNSVDSSVFGVAPKLREGRESVSRQPGIESHCVSGSSTTI